MHKFEGRSDIVRDPNTRAIINIDSEAHRAAVESSKARESFRNQIKNNTKDINIIKEDILEIKEIMRQMKKILRSNLDDGR